MPSHGRISPEDAAAIWRRAAHLQAEAVQRMEERSRALSAGESQGGIDPEHLTLDEVRAAAAEVGIGSEFVALAITEMRADPAGGLPPELEEKATRFLGTAERSIELSRAVEKPVSEVYSALQRVLPAQPWQLSLRDMSGNPLNGGPLIFDLPRITLTAVEPSPLAYHAYAVDVQQVQISLRPTGHHGGEAGCEILLRAGLQRSVRRNFRFGRWSSVVAGALGAGGGAATGVFALGLAGAMIALPAAAGAALLGGGAAVAYRSSYRHYLNRFTGILDDMLAAIAVHARTGGTFASHGLPPLPATSDGEPKGVV